MHGYEIDSDVALARAGPAPGALGTVRVRGTQDSPLALSCELAHMIVNGEGAPAYALGRAGDRLVSWHADSGSFLIDGPASRIDHRRADAAEGPDTVDPVRWEHRLGSRALPLLASGPGCLPLHASAVAIGGGAVVVCGVTGRGKSTLAANLVARGHEAIAEDGIVVRFEGDDPVVWPGLAGSMITAPAARAIGIDAAEVPADSRGRFLVPVPRVVSGPTPVVAVVVLMERAGDRVRLSRPPAPKAHRELLAHAIGARPRGPAAFSASARLVERVPMSLLRVPDRLAAMGPAGEALESLRDVAP